VSVLAYNAAAGDWNAAERTRLNAIGQTPSFVDDQIAAIVVMRDLILVTTSVTDVDGFSGIVVEDWHAWLPNAIDTRKCDGSSESLRRTGCSIDFR
jgi:predicted nucleic acid-binding protein